VPKLIDFGIASIHHDGAPAQATQLHPMTLEYASPEQLRGTAITTATDVYSLGVVLYELLVGQLPHSSKAVAPHELARLICETVPVRPSAAAIDQPEEHCRRRGATRARLRSQLRGDLDNIVLQALRKEPEHRYSSVERFAEDLRRLSSGLPVTATRGSWHYRTSKFVRRHWAGTIATAAALIAVMAGLAVAMRETRLANHQAEVARQQRSLADRRFNDLRKLADSMLFEVHDSIKDLPGATLARKLLVTRAIEYLDSISAESRNDTLLLRDLVVAYQKIGDVQGQPRQANLGDVAGAELSYRKARELGERLVAAEPGNLDLRRDLVKSYGKLSDLLAAKGDLAGAMEYSGKQMATATAVYEADPKSIANRTLYAVYRMDHGYKQATLGGDLPQGLRNVGLGAELLEQLAIERPQDHYVHRILGLSYSRAAELQDADTIGLQQALALYQKALAVKQQLLAAEPNNADYQRLVAYDKFTIGSVLKQLGRQREAIALDREALASFEQLARADPVSPLYRHDVAEARHDLGEMLADSGVTVEAVEQLQLSLAALRALTDNAGPTGVADPIAASDLYWLGEVHVRAASLGNDTSHQQREHCREARIWFGQALPALQQVLRHSAADPVIAEQIRNLQRDRQRCADLPVSLVRQPSR
jgi:tetratricopeptide (TPR) repeat protein